MITWSKLNAAIVVLILALILISISMVVLTLILTGVINVNSRVLGNKNESLSQADIYYSNLNKNYTKCGRLYMKNNHNRIIYGQKAGDHAWPWVVSLRVITDRNKYSTHYCAGTLIDQNFVLTAGHCVDKYRSDEILIVIGVNKLNEELNRSNMFYASKVIIHPDYNKSNIRNDIALIRLTQPIYPSSKVDFVCLPDSRDIQINEREFIVVGWYRILCEF